MTKSSCADGRFAGPVRRGTVLIAGCAAAQTARAPGDSTADRRQRACCSAADMAMRHKQFCQDAYAHQVGDLAYLEARLVLTAAQQPLFDRWKTVKLDIAKRGAADCATRELPMRDQARETPLDAMAREEDNLKHRIADLDAERPVLGAFYNVLTAAQKMALMHPGPEPMMDRHRMLCPARWPRAWNTAARGVWQSRMPDASAAG